MDKYKDYPEVSKEGGGGGGFRRFLLLVAVVAVLAFLVASWSGRAVVTENHGGVADVVTTATAPAAGVAVNVEQSAPSISVNVEQAAPPPAAAPTSDNTVALLAYQNADRALLEAATANTTANNLLPRVAALETTAAMPRPDLSPTLIAFQATADQHERELNALTAGVLVALLLVMVVAGVVGYMTIYHHPPTPTPPTPLLTQTAPLTLHGANTVLHGADTVQQTTYPVHSTTSGDILRPLNLRPRPLPMPKRLDELTDEQRRYIQQTYNRLKTFSGTSRHIWNYHNATTLGIVKDVVGQGDSQRLQ
jgi:hypothetical protein